MHVLADFIHIPKSGPRVFQEARRLARFPRRKSGEKPPRAQADKDSIDRSEPSQRAYEIHWYQFIVIGPAYRRRGVRGPTVMTRTCWMTKVEDSSADMHTRKPATNWCVQACLARLSLKTPELLQ